MTDTTSDTTKIEKPQGTANAGQLQREIYFPTFIYYLDLANGAEINDLIKPHIYAWQEEDVEGIVRSNVDRVGSWHSHVDMYRREQYSSLIAEIRNTAQTIWNDLGYDPGFEPAFANMWANINPKYGYNRNHVHPNSLWSGVYYVQVPTNAGRIFFSDPRPQVPLLSAKFAPDRKRGAESWTEVHYEPIEGRLILFPSWLVHEVEPNMSDLEGPAGDRVSVSFNLLQRQRDAC